ncbi:type II toxin-antitoxin system MqsA family antitoxin [bacterium]|nr:type II toxin-antitoxin system MqsA family antitoxin [bacterium]
MDKSPLCPETGLKMVRAIKPMTLSYKGESVTFNMPGWYCEESGEGVHTGIDLKTSDRMLNLLKARVEGLLLPAEIRQIRRRLRITQGAAGNLIGGGPRAFQKYESGDLLPSRAVCSALLMLDSAPELLDLLKARQVATAVSA